MSLTKSGIENIRKSKLGSKNHNFIKGKTKFRTYNWLYKSYIEKELSLKSIANIVGVSTGCICKWMNNVGIERRKFCNRRGHLSSRWNGGRQGGNGKYVYIYKPSHPRANRRHIPEHTLVAEEILGRYLYGDEIIHHINGIKDDNRHKNLYIFSDDREHQRYHQKLRKNSTEPISESNLLMSK